MAKVILADDTRSAMLLAIRDQIDAGNGAGTLTVATDGGEVLGVLSFSKPSAELVSNALVFNAIAEDKSARKDGMASQARLADASGNAVMIVDVSDQRGTGVIKFNTTEIKAGGPIRIDALRLSL